MTTISVSSAIDPAARIRCSSSERFMDAPSLLVRENAGKGRRLPQTSRTFAVPGDEHSHGLPGLLQHALPFPEPRRRTFLPSCAPAFEITASDVQQPGIALDLPRDYRMH